MIQLDHTHVFSTFHQYKVDARHSVKQGLVNTSCTALEIHAQLEGEIFYPAVLTAGHVVCSSSITKSRRLYARKIP